MLLANALFVRWWRGHAYGADARRPPLLSLLVGLAIGLVAWGFVHGRGSAGSDALMQASDGMLLGLLALAAFAMGVFLAYHVLTFGGN